jgi:hypothetical protein
MNGLSKITLRQSATATPATTATGLRPGWPEFVAALESRLDAGERAYGDSSFKRPPGELTAEIEEELLDVAGWGFILWSRLHRMRAALEKEQG